MSVLSLKEHCAQRGFSGIDWDDAVRLARRQFDGGFCPETILEQAFGVVEADYEMDLLEILAGAE